MSKKQKNISLIIILLLTIMNSILLFNSSGVKTDFTLIIKFIILLISTCFMSIFLISKRNKNIERTFLIIYVILGMFYLILFPMNSLVDETHHFYRSYEISKGRPISEKYKYKNGYLGVTKVTKNIKKVVESSPKYKENFKLFNLKDKKSKEEYVELTNISMYSFVCYIPQALGVLISRTFNLPIIFWGYFARLFNFIMFIFLIRFSIKNIPYKKTSLMFILLLPMVMQTAVSMSADCMALGTSLALISYVLRLINNDDKISKKDYIILFVLSILLSLSKIVYLPICLLIFLIPKNKFKNKEDKYIKLGSIFLISLILNLMWLFIASSYLASVNDSNLQLIFILKHPIKFIYIIFSTYVRYTEYYIYTMMGSKLASLNLYITNNYISLDIIIAILLMMFDTDNKINKSIKRFCLLIFLMVVFLISTSLYLDWTLYGSEFIDGIQGRYFLPIFILLFIILNTDNFKIKNKDIFNRLNMLLFLIMENIYILIYMTIYFSNI